ncbi:MAG: hypothetical protein E7360_03125 [Clostridiales bacterium]|nr:hypothetical protein [Clostridiales bacterium]
MFDLKCVYCEFFNRSELCQKGLDEENCTAFIRRNEEKEDKPDCNNCEWFSNGFCDFDMTNPLSCRRFKSK